MPGKLIKSYTYRLFTPRIPIFEALKEYPSSFFKLDSLAGLNVALLAIPQGMAYALVAGLPIHYGLIGSAIAALLGGLLGEENLLRLDRLTPPQF